MQSKESLFAHTIYVLCSPKQISNCDFTKRFNNKIYTVATSCNETKTEWNYRKEKFDAHSLKGEKKRKSKMGFKCGPRLALNM